MDFDPLGDVIDRVAGLGPKRVYAKQDVLDPSIGDKGHTVSYGDAELELRNGTPPC